MLLKTVESAAALQEARCLLAFPAGVAPAVLDILPAGAGYLTLVLEKVEGRPASTAAARLPSTLLPLFAQGLCQCLVHMHRTGWIHADISPANVVVRRRSDGVGVRLIDFGYAIDRYAAPDEERRGGTIPFVAPELAQGWIVDGRADLYSLGVLLREAFPPIRRDRRWRPILDRLCAALPADRYANAPAARDEIARAFDLPEHPDRWPRFGSGPLCGRGRQLSAVQTALRRRGARVLVQALPGAGLTRFLLEAAIRSAEAGSPVRVVDLQGPEGVTGPALDHLESIPRSSESVLCGVDDPSPGLHWTPGAAGDRLRRMIARDRWTRIDLPPVAAADVEEMVLAALGVRDPAAEALARTLFDRSEGDLRICTEGFESCVRRCAAEDGIGFRLTPDRLAEWLDGWSPKRPGPPLASVPAPLAPALRSIARAGTSFPMRTGRGLLERYYRTSDLETLLDHGFLVRSTPHRLRFVSRALWSDAIQGDSPQSADIDLWLHERLAPSADCAEETLHAAARARRLGDQIAEARFLGNGLTRADMHRRWQDARVLLAHPAGPPPRWTDHFVRQQVEALSQVLRPRWTADRLTALAGTSLRPIDRELGIALLERAATSEDDQAATYALTWLAEDAAVRSDAAGLDQHLARLQACGGTPSRTLRGVLQHFAARRLLLDRKPQEAATLAEQARKALRGSGAPHDSINLQLLAALRFTHTPAAALRLVKSSIGSTIDPELRAQGRYNLALMCARLGKSREAALWSDLGVREALSDASPARLLGCRVIRAWSWAALDQVQPALDEARMLLQTTDVRTTPRHLVPVRLLLGYCLLHRGLEPRAVDVFLHTWQQVPDTEPVLAAQSLRYLVDALLDTEAWENVRAHADALRRVQPSDDTEGRMVAARAEALLALAEGRPRVAWDLLERHLSTAQHLTTRTDAARYVHQLGVTLLQTDARGSAREAARRAAGLFRRELTMLPPSGYSYYRSRALLRLSTALERAGQRSASSNALSQAIAVARRSQCQRILESGLDLRIRARLRGRPSVG